LQESLSAYRSHKPNISLDDSTKKVLHSFRNVHKYIVTDGNKLVQKRKIEALHLNSIFQHCFITHNFGLQAAKPSIFCFDKIKIIEAVDWIDMVYIGDDPKKDFINLKPLGVKTIRVMTGRYANTDADKNHDAEYRIPNLSYLEDAIQSIYG
jgi:putative hydrolase of the HAD superfamily